MPNVLIATLCKNTITAQTTLSLVNMVKGIDIPVDYIIQMGADIPGARNMLIKKARDKGYSHIFFVDEDVSFTSSINPLIRLLSHNKDIIGADYHFREFPIRSMTDPFYTTTEELTNCRTIPSGFMLIRLSIFDTIPQPWFLFEWNDEGTMTSSEDVYFCKRARDAGYSIWCDNTLEVKHIGTYAY